MREKFNHLYLDSHERKLLIHSLVELKNQLIQQGRYTDCGAVPHHDGGGCGHCHYRDEHGGS